MKIAIANMTSRRYSFRTIHAPANCLTSATATRTPAVTGTETHSATTMAERTATGRTASTVRNQWCGEVENLGAGRAEWFTCGTGLLATASGAVVGDNCGCGNGRHNTHGAQWRDRCATTATQTSEAVSKSWWWVWRRGRREIARCTVVRRPVRRWRSRRRCVHR